MSLFHSQRRPWYDASISAVSLSLVGSTNHKTYESREGSRAGRLKIDLPNNAP
eukprot:COSAG06_NODE_2333_length_7059_cov_109.820402_1_plen_53_part_00